MRNAFKSDPPASSCLVVRRCSWRKRWYRTELEHNNFGRAKGEVYIWGVTVLPGFEMFWVCYRDRDMMMNILGKVVWRLATEYVVLLTKPLHEMILSNKWGHIISKSPWTPAPKCSRDVFHLKSNFPLTYPHWNPNAKKGCIWDGAFDISLHLKWSYSIGMLL